MATIFRCFLTNNSRYDLKLKRSDVRQFSLIHQTWAGQWDVPAPALIKAGQQADPNRPTFQGLAGGIDGVAVYADYDLMDGAESKGVVSFQGRAWNDWVQKAEAYVMFGQDRRSELEKLINVENSHRPPTGPEITQRITLSNK